MDRTDGECVDLRRMRESKRKLRERKERKFRQRGREEWGERERPHPKCPWFSWEFHSPDASGDQKVTTLPDNTLVSTPRARENRAAGDIAWEAHAGCRQARWPSILQKSVSYHLDEPRRHA